MGVFCMRPAAVAWCVWTNSNPPSGSAASRARAGYWAVSESRMANPPPDPARCPFCAGSNACAADSGSCWCFALTVPQGLLALVPEAQRNRACICQRCIQSFVADPPGFAARFSRR
ncbi:MAG: cysteine-rich CWC family protein [Pseudomonadota bacterium]|uniref:cysteine-rich CWC family protein n=1 Tax=Halopseudomonas TaxID=2901189 RepID=UPI002E8921A6|nr:cysteine-rich CWC family protein [Pseudomonadota bacterium]